MCDLTHHITRLTNHPTHMPSSHATWLPLGTFYCLPTLPLFIQYSDPRDSPEASLMAPTSCLSFLSTVGIQCTSLASEGHVSPEAQAHKPSLLLLQAELCLNQGRHIAFQAGPLMRPQGMFLRPTQKDKLHVAQFPLTQVLILW